jgi:tRNA1(Val) A37 N6-methylase TrmN6
MSMIGNKLKSGFVATPSRQGEYIKKLIHFKGEGSVFDPTCGEGEILNQIVSDQVHTLTTYGVEIDQARASKAKKKLNFAIQAPIESMVITNDIFSLIYLNPPYDFEIKGVGEERAERKEYTELVRNTRYLTPRGLIVYVIPSYRFSDTRIARFLSTNFTNVGMMRFSDEDYEDYTQCLFIGEKKSVKNKEFNKSLYDFLIQMESDEFIKKNVTPIDRMIGHKTWDVPSGPSEVKTFYTKLENKKDFIEAIQQNKGFIAFKERTRPKQLVIGGDPIINIAQGQMALLLASGAVNGILGAGPHLHAVQGMEIVSKVETVQKTESSTTTKIRTKREISVKVITPRGIVKKFV